MAKTFDQQRILFNKDEFLDETITSPNKAIKSYMVLEPVEHQGITRVRVTARDEEMNVLWGVMVSEGLMPSGSTTPVSLYSTLRNLIRTKLKKTKPRHEISSDPYESIEHCQKAINDLIAESFKKTVKIKNKNKVTNSRATEVSDILWDTLQQLAYSLDKIGIKNLSSSNGTEK